MLSIGLLHKFSVQMLNKKNSLKAAMIRSAIVCRGWVWIVCAHHKIHFFLRVYAGYPDRKGEGGLQHLRGLHSSGGCLFAREALRWERRGQQVRDTGEYSLASLIVSGDSLNSFCFVWSFSAELSSSGPGKSSPCQQSSRRSLRDGDCSSW